MKLLAAVAVSTAVLAVSPIAVTADESSCAGRAYATNSYLHNVSVIDTDSNELVGVVPVGLAPYSPTIAPDGSRVYIANSESGTISVIDTATNTVVDTLDAGGAHPAGLAVTPDGAHLVVSLLGATIFHPGTVRVIEAETGVFSDPIPVGTTPERVALSPDGTRAYIINSAGTLTVIDVPNRVVVGEIPMVGPAFTVVVSDDGTKLFGALINNDAVAVIDATTNQVEYVPTDEGPIGISFSPDQDSVFVTNGSAGTIQEISVETLEVTRTADGGLRPGYLQVSGDGARGYITRSPGTGVAVYDMATLTEVDSVLTGWPTAIAVCGAA